MKIINFDHKNIFQITSEIGNPKKNRKNSKKWNFFETGKEFQKTDFGIVFSVKTYVHDRRFINFDQSICFRKRGIGNISFDIINAWISIKINKRQVPYF